ncbi:hypothetical protein [Mycobacterium montefiorense]|nr:hypothetical protein [Mycobacterium montefiorense]
MNPRIAYTGPSITELEVRYATDAAANGWGRAVLCIHPSRRFRRR